MIFKCQSWDNTKWAKTFDDACLIMIYEDLLKAKEMSGYYPGNWPEMFENIFSSDGALDLLSKDRKNVENGIETVRDDPSQVLDRVPSFDEIYDFAEKLAPRIKEETLKNKIKDLAI